MSVMFLLVPLSVAIAAGFLYAFIWAVRSGQFEDTTTPALRLLLEEAGKRNAARPATSQTESETPRASERPLTSLAAGHTEDGRNRPSSANPLAQTSTIPSALLKP